MTSTHGPLTIERDRLRALGETIAGEVLTPDSEGSEAFRAASSLYYRHLDRTPALVVRPRDTDDVAAAVAFARASGLEIAVRGGGHSLAGHSTVEDGLVIDLQHLDRIEIDVDERVARVGGGATAGAVTAAAGDHGLVIGFGDTGSVGVGGITLGGGAGFVSRAHGLTIDNLLAVELVTAEGRVVVADADHHPDLFWGLRGGGGGFGVATRFTFRLRSLPQVVGGMLVVPATVDTVTEFVRLAQAAPEELSAMINVMPAPPMPFLPKEQHGQLVVLALLTYAGPAEAAEPVLAPFRAVATPLADLLHEMPYPGMFQPEPEDFHPIATIRTGFSRGFDRSHAQLILDTLTKRLAAPELQMAIVNTRVLGGAISRVSTDATAYAHREWPLMVNVAAVVGDPQALDEQRPWIEALGASLSEGTPGAYGNFVGDEGPDRIHDIYPPETYARLARVKAEWDPDNVFQRGHTVPPERPAG
ncbi:MAG TPA: FAD-binding oxidoreductase [Intrasporangium sp.]|uniref:FAD-binding oxidoreductase n=1 Tax=Intrasporangium sp. TaxID=1925024 RepID=UPI002B4673DC|nr:FAD-binding oxidoreductase [Intrasporangium sp.]HKX66249.1 FAD-binding oxidoreductase [Intrasporangium sp.]